MKILFRDVRAGKRKAALADLKSIARREIEKTMNDLVKPMLIEEHEEVVQTWKHKPGFAARRYIKPDRIEIAVFPTGKHKMIWIYVDQGTKPHTITPRRKPYLQFKAGRYVPKTLRSAGKSRVVLGGGYMVNPKWVRTKLVKHPGTEARQFSKQIAEEIKPVFKKLIEAALRRTAQLSRR